MFRKDNAAVIQVSYFQIQWGSEYLTFEYPNHSNTCQFGVRHANGSVFKWLVCSKKYDFLNGFSLDSLANKHNLYTI